MGGTDQRTNVTLNGKIPSKEEASAFPSPGPLEVPVCGSTNEPSTFSSLSAEGHWNFVQLPSYTLQINSDSLLQILLPTNSPYLPHCFQLLPFLQRLNSFLVFQNLLNPASTLPHPRQFYCLSPNIVHCTVQGSFSQEAFWTRSAQHCLPPARSMWSLSHGYQCSLTLTVPTSLHNPLFPFCHSNSHTPFSPSPCFPFHLLLPVLGLSLVS